MANSDQSQRLALECLRLEADCMQLAADARNPDLQSHFLWMAGFWQSNGVSRLSPPAVLIVEDDPLLMMLAVDVVEHAGYEALQADSADAAVAILECRSGIALLFTDVNMPGSMDGMKLAHAVRDRWPPVKIIVVSSRAPEGELPADSRFFAKPYHAETMISEIRSLIGS